MCLCDRLLTFGAACLISPVIVSPFSVRKQHDAGCLCPPSCQRQQTCAVAADFGRPLTCYGCSGHILRESRWVRRCTVANLRLGFHDHSNWKTKHAAQTKFATQQALPAPYFLRQLKNARQSGFMMKRGARQALKHTPTTLQDQRAAWSARARKLADP